MTELAVFKADMGRFDHTDEDLVVLAPNTTEGKRSFKTEKKPEAETDVSALQATCVKKVNRWSTVVKPRRLQGPKRTRTNDGTDEQNLGTTGNIHKNARSFHKDVQVAGLDANQTAFAPATTQLPASIR